MKVHLIIIMAHISTNFTNFHYDILGILIIYYNNNFMAILHIIKIIHFMVYDTYLDDNIHIYVDLNYFLMAININYMVMEENDEEVHFNYILNNNHNINMVVDAFIPYKDHKYEPNQEDHYSSKVLFNICIMDHLFG